MNSSDLVELSRKDRTFIAVSEETVQRLQKLRQYLCLPPSQEKPKMTDDGDEGAVFDCADVEDVIREITNRFDQGVLHHSKFETDQCFGVMFGEEEFPSLGPNDAAIRPGTKPVKLATARGVESFSYALLSENLTFGVTHRCAIRIVGMPQEAEAPQSPGRHVVESGSPRSQLSKQLLNNHANKHNFSCFGITRSSDRDRDDDNVQFTRWVGLYWHQEKGSNHITAFSAGIQRNGQPLVTALDHVKIQPGDVLGMEVLCAKPPVSCGPVWCYFTLNGKRIVERNLIQDLPVATKVSAGMSTSTPAGPGPHHYENCQFGVQLSPNMQVALLSLV